MAGAPKRLKRQLAKGIPLRPSQRRPHNKGELKTMAAKGASRKELREAGATPAEAAILRNYHDNWTPAAHERELVQDCTMCGMTPQQICRLFEVKFNMVLDPTELRAKFKDQLDTATDALILEAGRVIKRGIHNMDSRDARFFLERRGKWNQTTQLADPNGRPLQPPRINVIFGDDDEQSATTDTKPEGQE